MDANDLSGYKNLYIKTAQEHITKLGNNLQIIKTDTGNKNAIHEAYIDSHSLKGQSVMMGYVNTGRLARMMEVTFKHIEEGKVAPESQILHALQEAYDALGGSIKGVADTNQESDLSSQVKKLEEVTGIRLE